jgi:glycosyltransferase involved in cell wall biosynthesis
MRSGCRVLVLNERDSRHPSAGGAETHVEEISRRMAAFGFEITLAASSFPGAPSHEQRDGFTVRRLGKLAFYYPHVVWSCAWETFRGRFDVVVEHLNKVPFCAAAYSSVPVIAVNHHLFGSSAFLQVSWPVAAAVVGIEKLIPLVYRRTPFLAVSQSSKDDLIARGIAAERIAILHNGITPPSQSTRPVTERPCRVAYLGRLEPYKRVDLMLRALATLVEPFPALEIVLVGRGTARPGLEQLAVELGIAERTRFTGFVDDAERNALIAEARVCVCPSVKEGWGITVIEANALGTPVIATDAPGLADAVRHDETGLLVADGAAGAFTGRLASAVADLLSDDARLAKLSAGALAWSKRFDWDRSAEQMAQAVEAALASKR